MVWYILLGVAALCFLLCCVPLSLTVALKEDGTLRLCGRVLGIPIFRSPERQRRVSLSHYSPHAMQRRERKRRRALFKKQRKDKSGQKKSARSTTKKRPTLGELGEQISYVADLAHTIFSRSLHHASVDVRALTITVGSPDAARTAILYGTISASFTCLLEAIRSFTHLRIRRTAHVGVSADFTAEKCRANVRIRFRLRLWQIADVALRALVRTVRHSSSNHNSNKKS